MARSPSSTEVGGVSDQRVESAVHDVSAARSRRNQRSIRVSAIRDRPTSAARAKASSAKVVSRQVRGKYAPPASPSTRSTVKLTRPGAARCQAIRSASLPRASPRSQLRGLRARAISIRPNGTRCPAARQATAARSSLPHSGVPGTPRYGRNKSRASAATAAAPGGVWANGPDSGFIGAARGVRVRLERAVGAHPRDDRSHHRTRLPDLGAEADGVRRRRALGPEPGARCPRAHRRADEGRPAAASHRRHDGQRGEAGASRRRHSRARQAGQCPRAAAPSGSRPLHAVLQHVGPLPRRHAHRAGGAVAMHRARAFRPFAARGRHTVVGILLTFALFSAVSVSLSIWATSRSRHRASVLEVAARQRTLAERYVQEVLLARAGAQADPARTAHLLDQSAKALLNGGVAPAVNGDDDETKLPAATGPVVRAQLRQEGRLVSDLAATGSALLARRPVTEVRLAADERLSTGDPVERLRVLAALTSNVSLNAARTIGASDDLNIGNLIVLQVVLGGAGLLTSLLLALALIVATRRQTAHFRSLVTSSTDLVLVFGAGGCRYVSQSVTTMLGREEPDLLGDGLVSHVHVDDRASMSAASLHGEPREIVFRMQNGFGEWRQLEAHVTDLRADRQIRGVVLNARDITERMRLEEQLTQQAFHDSLTGLPNRALFRDRLDQALARSDRSDDVLAVLLLDLDGFKQVNDSLGHDAGDQLLQEVAVRFADVIRPSDTLARFGGDEFALLLEGANEPPAVTAAERLLDRLAEPIRIAGHELAVGASIGIAIHPGGPPQSADRIRHADLAMYAAKEAGRGRYEVFCVGMARELGELLGLEQGLPLGPG